MEINKEQRELCRENENSRKYGDRLLVEELAFWQNCKDFEQKYKWQGGRGHETLRHYFANLPNNERDRVVKAYWDEKNITPKQLRILKEMFFEQGYYLVREDLSMLEASMLLTWIKDFYNLDKKSLYDCVYVFSFDGVENDQDIYEYLRRGCIGKVESVYCPGVIGAIEMFTFKKDFLEYFVVYTYYNKEEEPLYIGYSTSFYDAHYFNQGKQFGKEIEYVGFVFFENAEEMKDAKKYYIEARNPKYNKRKYKAVPCLEGLDISSDDIVVRNEEMTRRWQEWLGQESN